MCDVRFRETQPCWPNEALVFRCLAGKRRPDKRHLRHHTLPLFLCASGYTNTNTRKNQNRAISSDVPLAAVKKGAGGGASACLLFRLPVLMTLNISSSVMGATLGSGTLHLPAFCFRFSLIVLLSTYATMTTVRLSTGTRRVLSASAPRGETRHASSARSPLPG